MNTHGPKQPEHEPDSTSEDRRRPYGSPKLVEYGPIAKLTQSQKGSGSEQGGGGKKRNCL